MTIKAQNIIKQFDSQTVLHGIDVHIDDGEFISISGRSGSGKSTLLYILSTLDKPTEGTITIDNLNLKKATASQIDQLRSQNIGFIFQFHYLLPELTALENALLPARNLNLIKEKTAPVKSLFDELEILDQMHKKPSEMSGGQQQRVAIARALSMQPKYIFADEPTGNLDTYNAQKVMEILLKINQRDKTTIVLVTHDMDYSRMAKRIIFLSDGRVVDSPIEINLKDHN